jgi:hypothetical protein
MISSELDFDDDLGERFDILDARTDRWPLPYYEQPLRPIWDRLGLDVKRHWIALYPGLSGECDMLAHMVARVLQEMATHLGDDDALAAAVVAVVHGDVDRASPEGRTLDEVAAEWGDDVLTAVMSSVREASLGLRPEKN